LELNLILYFLIFQIIILFSSIRLFYILIQEKLKEEISIEKQLIIWFSFNTILSIGISSLFSFTRFNDHPQYILSVLTIITILHFIQKRNLKEYFDYLKKIFFKLSNSIFDWKIIIIFAGLIPMLWWGLTPPDDTDSLYLLNWNFLWITNQTSPYDNWFNYLPLHQLSFVPSMVISNSDHYFWMSMIMPIILLGLTTYAIGKEFKLNKYLIWISVFSSLLFFRLWMSWGPAFGSMKDDALMGVGLLLIVLSIMNSKKENLTRQTFVLFLLGTIFVSAKWAGLSVVIIASIIFVLMNYKEITKHKKQFCIWAIIIFGDYQSFTPST